MNIDELLKSNANLEDYLNDYYQNPEFIFKYYRQDINRIIKNFYIYSAFLNIEDKLYLFKVAIDNRNYEVANELLKDIDNLYLGFTSYKETIDKVFNELIELDKEGKIDINKLNGSVFLFRSNPLYFIKKNSNNIKKYYYNLDINTINEILNYLFSINYKFREEDEPFITKCVIQEPSCLASFLKQAQYDPSIDNLISAEFDKLSNNDLYALYNNIKNSNKENILYNILSKLNYNNYDYNTIVKDKDLCLNCDTDKDKVISLLKEIGNNYKANIILVMNRVDMDLVNEAYSLVGDSLKILPLNGQMSNRFDDYRNLKDCPYYDYNHIKQSEDKLNLYASMVNDTKDKDGDIKSLSPLEKFIAAYILTSKFAPYKEENNGRGYESRSVYEFINSITKTTIVCVGFTHLLREILYRMGITDTMDWHVKINGQVSSNGDHMRMMIHLIDQKYGIDGIYMSDPTFDNRKDTELKFNHMLMSHDELLEVDKNIDLNDLKANETILMEDGLHVSDAYSMFRKPIPKEVLVKAHLALEHFLDKNMKMVNDNNYSLLEYTAMASKLHYYEIIDENKEKVFNELQNMSINEISNNYPNLLDELLYNISSNIERKLKENEINIPLVSNYNHEDRKMFIGFKYEFASQEFPNRSLTIEDINELREVVPNNRINENYGEAKFYIEVDTNKKVSEVYGEAIDNLIELNNLYQNITRNNKKNEVK